MIARLTAAAVHLLTASGAVLALLALRAVHQGDWRMMFVWLGAALIVDAADGPLARRLEVMTVLPRFSGERLDLIVDYLTYVVIAYDPVYLSEPLVRSTEYRLNVNQQIPPYPCTVVTEVDRPKGVVPHYLPGTNNDISWFSRRYGIPMDVVTAGAANMYPDIRAMIPRSLGGFGPEPPPSPATKPTAQRPAPRAGQEQ